MTEPTDLSEWPALDPEGSPVELHAFDHEHDRWDTLPETSRDTPPEIDALELVTWNIWFSTWRKQERLELLLDTLLVRPRDIIALQELTRDALERITEHPDIRQRYAITGARGETLDAKQGYGNITLVSRENGLTDGISARSHRFSTSQGRCLLLVSLRDGTLIANTHLESKRGNGIVREEQIRDVLSITKGKSLIWMGDFNFSPDFDEQSVLPEALEDAWATCRPGEDGFTIDSDKNPILYAIGRKSKRVRFDRVLARGMTARDCAIVGDDGDDPILRPSDHFGLEARVVR